MVLALVISACGATQSNDSGDVSPELGGVTANLESTGNLDDFSRGEPTDAPEQAPNADVGTDELGSGAITVQADPVDLGRDIVYTASISVEVNDVTEATRRASQIMQGFGGLLFGQQTTGGTDPRTVLTFRVLPTDFTAALDALGSLGTIRDQQVSADDVTERVVDLESRINTAAASVERLRVLLEGATNINDIAALENQLLQRETNLETLRGQLRTVQDQVDLATITVAITEAMIRPAISISVSSYPGEGDQGLACPGSPNLVVDEGTITTVCFEIRNSGDTPLRDIQLSDPVLDVDLSDLTPVFIQPEEVLEPGQSAIYFLEMPADKTLRLQTRVSAVAVDEDGDPLPGRGVANTATATIQAADPGGVPTFADGLEASWEALVTLGEVLVLVAGAILPFIWIVPLVWLFRRRRAGTPEVVETPDPEPEHDAELVDA